MKRPQSVSAFMRPIVPLEHDVQRAVLRYLSLHPRVAKVWRVNSGAVKIGEGKAARYLRFTTLEGCPDLHGILRDGRYLAVEIKRPGFKRPTDTREKQQAEFLATVSECGGVAGFVTSIDDAKKLLETACPNATTWP